MANKTGMTGSTTGKGNGLVKKAVPLLAPLVAKLLEEAVRDGRVNAAASAIKDKLLAGARSRNPVEQLNRQLNAVDQAIAGFSALPSFGDDANEVAAQQRWTREVALLRTKITPLAAMPAKSRKKACAALQQRVQALLDEVVNFGAASIESEEQ